MPEAPWRRRFRAPRLSLPQWARAEPDRLLYSSNASVKWLRELGAPHEVYRYDAGLGSLVVKETIRQVELMLAFTARHLGTTRPT